MNADKITLITGGARSGKSRFALSQLESCEKKIFLATAEIFDAEMQTRVEKHREERSGFETIEEPLHLGQALSRVSDPNAGILIDCLTVWMGNLTHHFSQSASDRARIASEVEHFKRALMQTESKIVIVTNEIGMGIVPDNALSRSFRDAAGKLNQEIAAIAQTVYFVVSGIPWKIK